MKGLIFRNLLTTVSKNVIISYKLKEITKEYWMKTFIKDNAIKLEISILSVIIAYVFAIWLRGFQPVAGETCWLAANIVYWKIKWLEYKGRQIKWN